MPLEDTQTAVRAGWKMRKNKETVAYRYIYIYAYEYFMHTYVCMYICHRRFTLNKFVRRNRCAYIGGRRRFEIQERQARMYQSREVAPLERLRRCWQDGEDTASLCTRIYMYVCVHKYTRVLLCIYITQKVCPTQSMCFLRRKKQIQHW